MFVAADQLRPVNMTECNIVNRREMAGGERLQGPDIDIAYRITLTGADGGQVTAGNDRQRAVTAQVAGLLILLLIIVADSA